MPSWLRNYKAQDYQRRYAKCTDIIGMIIHGDLQAHSVLDMGPEYHLAQEPRMHGRCLYDFGVSILLVDKNWMGGEYLRSRYGRNISQFVTRG